MTQEQLKYRNKIFYIQPLKTENIMQQIFNIELTFNQLSLKNRIFVHALTYSNLNTTVQQKEKNKTKFRV